MTGLLSRTASLAESTAALAETGRQTDALVLLRSLYEHGITFLWLAIDPRPRVIAWYGGDWINKRDHLCQPTGRSSRPPRARGRARQVSPRLVRAKAWSYERFAEALLGPVRGSPSTTATEWVARLGDAER